MPKIVKNPLAQQDLIGIWHYTYENWGVAQADKYLRELNQALEGLEKNPALGQARDDIRHGYRSLHIKRHVVFYKSNDVATIRIVRVLHERMDALSHV